MFGEFACGGLLTRRGNAVGVLPRDGLRVRFHVIRGEQRLHMTLDHDGFAADRPVVVADDLSRIEFALENRAGGAHRTGLTLAGLPEGDYRVTVDGTPATAIAGGRPHRRIALPIGASGIAVVAIVRQ